MQSRFPNSLDWLAWAFDSASANTLLLVIAWLLTVRIGGSDLRRYRA